MVSGLIQPDRWVCMIFCDVYTFITHVEYGWNWREEKKHIHSNRENLFIAFMKPHAIICQYAAHTICAKWMVIIVFKQQTVFRHFVFSKSEVYLSFQAFAITICYSQPFRSIRIHFDRLHLASIAGFHFTYFLRTIVSIRFHNFGNYYICNWTKFGLRLQGHERFFGFDSVVKLDLKSV